MSRRRLLIMIIAVCAFGSMGCDAKPKALSGGAHASIELKLVHEGLNRPIFMTQVPGSDIHLVVEQRGDIKWFRSNDRSAGGLFMRVPDTMTTANEEGLLGFAFDPDVTKNGYFYLHYTQRIGTTTDCENEVARKRSSCSIIARYQLAKNASGDFVKTQGDPTSKQVILMQRQPFSNHNGGMIAFGPDGFLYVGLGDGGSGGDPDGYAQNRQNLLGNILRIDVSKLPYAIPKDNPFIAAGSDIREEIWAYGLRNPWRFSFDAESGKLWVADVGQNAWEEVNVIESGGNYGWNFYEASHAYQNASKAPSDVIAPVIEYDHSQGVSITGGYVYRGSQMTSWKGWYFYGDFASGRLWAANTDKSVRSLDVKHVLNTNLSISSFAVDLANELYVLDFGGNVHKLVEN